MGKVFNNPFKITEDDTVGAAIIKGATDTYIRGVVVGGLGLGMLILGINALSNDDSIEDEEELEQEENEDKVLDYEEYKNTKTE